MVQADTHHAAVVLALLVHLERQALVEDARLITVHGEACAYLAFLDAGVLGHRPLGDHDRAGRTRGAAQAADATAHLDGLATVVCCGGIGLDGRLLRRVADGRPHGGVGVALCPGGRARVGAHVVVGAHALLDLLLHEVKPDLVRAVRAQLEVELSQNRLLQVSLVHAPARASHDTDGGAEPRHKHELRPAGLGVAHRDAHERELNLRVLQQAAPLAPVLLRLASTLGLADDLVLA